MIRRVDEFCGSSHVGTKPFERALLRLNAAVGVSLPGPSTQAHPLSGLAPASPSLQIAWGEIHPALHPNWLAQRENLGPRIKERQAQRTALRSERKAQQIESLAALALILAADAADAADATETADVASTTGTGPFRIVDFAGGSGPLALPLAALLPSCTVVIVDERSMARVPVLATAHAAARRFKSLPACSRLPLGTERSAFAAWVPRRGAAAALWRLPKIAGFVALGQQVKQRSLDLAVTRAAAAGLTNVQTWCGDITEYDEPFGLGLALHACGEASDLAMRACVEAGARFVVSPCCVGKLSGSALDPYKFNATGGNVGRIAYPRSKAVAAVLDTQARWRSPTRRPRQRQSPATHSSRGPRTEHGVSLGSRAELRPAWAPAVQPRSLSEAPPNAPVPLRFGHQAYDSVACAGEFAEKDQLTGARGALRRMCKSWLEHDRQLWAAEQSYACHVCRMVPEAASPKNHILCGWPRARPPPRDVAALLATEAVDGTLADAAVLLTLTPTIAGAAGAAGAAADGEAAREEQMGAALAASEWEPEEIAEVEALVRAYATGSTSGVADGAVDPTEPLVVKAPSSRRRRLVHYVAEAAGLAHRTENKKTVVIRHKGP